MRLEFSPSPKAAVHLIYVTHDQVEAMTLADPHRRHEDVLSAGGTPLEVYNQLVTSSSRFKVSRNEFLNGTL